MKKNGLDGEAAIHEYYMSIINCMPHIVYWIDINCNIKGFNANFATLLGAKQTGILTGTPYELMTNALTWSAARIDTFRLDDMTVLFSGAPTHDVDEPPVCTKKGSTHYYRSTRVPLFDKNNQIMGLVVILNDVTASTIIRPSQEPENTPNMNATHPIRVLIVEDNIIAQHVEHALLTALNCDVDIAESGNTAISLFAPGKYAIVFMDIGLHDTSGYVVSKTLRKMEQDTPHHVPIIAVTSYQAKVVKDDCIDYFMDGVLTKPLTHEQAIQIIKHYVYHENVKIKGLLSNTDQTLTEYSSMDLVT